MTRSVNQLWLYVCLVLTPQFYVFFFIHESRSAEQAGVTVQYDNYDGPATVSVKFLEPYKMRIDVDAKGDCKPLAIRVVLPISGPKSWPAADVDVRDSAGRAVTVRRNGIEWHKLLIPAASNVYFVQTAELPGDRLLLPQEKERRIADAVTGMSVFIAKWYDGRQAALSFRFDDSHPTHLSTAIPILREYGFRGSFMINPGKQEPNSQRRSDFQDHIAEWEAAAKCGDQEFVNHTAHHRGAIGDEDMESEIGEASKAIWDLFPGKSRLAALNLGGGTWWETTHTLRYYLDKYCLFDASQNSMGMDDSYGNRVEIYRRTLEQHLQRGLWFRVHYHSIGDGLSSSESNFRAVLDIAKEHADDIWIAGMADIYKYQTERLGSKLAVAESDEHHFQFNLSCRTNPELYDHPLTIEAAPPKSWRLDRLVLKNSKGQTMPFRTAETNGQKWLRFDVEPQNAAYTIEKVLEK